jgi:hypothetical protein
MFIVDEEQNCVDRVAPFILRSVEHERMATTVRFLGRLVAYLPTLRRSYYAWALVLTYRPAQHVSVYQLSPPHVRLTLFARLEFGLILGYWLLGLQLGQPLFWVKRLQPA